MRRQKGLFLQVKKARFASLASRRVESRRANLVNFNKGLTLVEILIYFGILSILLIVLTDMFVAILGVKRESEAVSAVDQDGRFILARLDYDINRATAIVTPVALGDLTTGLVLSIGPDTYTYSVVGNKLQLSVNSGAAQDLNSSESITSLQTFQKIGNVGGKETVQIKFTVSSAAVTASGPEVKQFQTAIGRR